MSPLPAPAFVSRMGLARRLSEAWDATLRVVRALEGRRQMHRLAHLDERALKDIGLLHTDVVGALEMPLHADPSTFLGLRSVARAARIHPVVVPPAP